MYSKYNLRIPVEGILRWKPATETVKSIQNVKNESVFSRIVYVYILMAYCNNLQILLNNNNNNEEEEEFLWYLSEMESLAFAIDQM